MLKKYREHQLRKRLKKDARSFADLISRYGLDLMMRNSLGDVAALRANDDFKQILTKKNHLDGNVTDLLLKITTSGSKFPVCVDIGAHYGLATVFLAKHAQKVFAFEPEGRNVARLETNLRENALTNVEVMRVALSNKKGKAKFYTSDASSHHSLGLAHTVLKEDSFVEVNTITLDEFCLERKIEEISVLKVDTEGFELEVLQGAERLLREKRVKHVLFEISKGVMERLGRDPHELAELLLSHGYKISTPSGAFVTRAELENIQYQDFLAVP